MKTITEELAVSLEYPYQIVYPEQNLLFFDIETTGLSASTSYIYLIGCVYIKEKTPIMIQWLADGIEEEKNLLINFFQLLQSYQILVHYNGSGFDIPFLQKKCQRYELSYSFDSVISLDIYRELKPLKKFLPLSSLKQRNVEEFLGIYRKDPFSGGDLISVYTQYVGTLRYEQLAATHPANVYSITKESGLPSIHGSKAEALRYTLLLHNREDLEGLLKISPLLSYVDLFHGNLKNVTCELTDAFLHLKFELFSPLPKPLEIEKELSRQYDIPSFHESIIRLSIKGLYGQCSIPFYKGRLKHFLKDYKDYYYLPYEDMAVHKSVAEFVDKEYRQKARKETCYIKKEGCFLPQPDALIQPEFQFEYKDKLLWFEVTEGSSFFQTKEASHMTDYLKSLLPLICSSEIVQEQKRAR